MAYTVRHGDTIQDVAFNVSGSLTAMDALLEYNTSQESAMNSVFEQQEGVRLADPTDKYSSTDPVLSWSGSGSLEVFVRTPPTLVSSGFSSTGPTATTGLFVGFSTAFGGLIDSYMYGTEITGNEPFM